MWASRVVSVIKNPPAYAEDSGCIPRLGGRPGGGNGYPRQDSGLENPTCRGAWRAAVRGVAEILRRRQEGARMRTSGAAAPQGPPRPPPRINDTDVHIRGEELLCTHVAWRVRVLKAEPLPLITTASPSASVRAPHVCARPSSRTTA